MIRIIITLLVLAFIPSEMLFAEPANQFDHFSTGYVLTGAHRIVECSKCHGQGLFKGTPRYCFGCHNSVVAIGKSATHIQSSNRCDDCHTTIAMTPARFDHRGVIGTCQTCHNSVTATGKNPGHINTLNNCELCHNTVLFNRVSRVDHAAVIGTCSSCHNNSTARGKHTSHIITTAECDTCHSTQTWRAARFDHAGVTPGTCSSCHNGTQATGKPSNHVQTTAQCDTCHSTSAWLPANFDHTNVTGACSTCHNNIQATGKPGGHFVTTQECDQCHTTNMWTPVLTYQHVSASYRQHTSSVTCISCHTTNNEVINWPFAAYQPDCAGCHANDFVPDSHKKVDSPTILYTVSELRDCTGSCHMYTDSTFTTIQQARTGQHRANSGAW